MGRSDTAACEKSEESAYVSKNKPCLLSLFTYLKLLSKYFFYFLTFLFEFIVTCLLVFYVCKW